MSLVLIQAIKQLVMRPVKRYSPLVARILLAPLFLTAAIGKLTNLGGTAEYMASHGLPMITLGLLLAILFLLLGGLSILLGFRARIGAAALFLFLIPTTLVFHAFWAVPIEEAGLQQAMFFKNVAIMGGLLLLINQGSGPLSVDAALGSCDES